MHDTELPRITGGVKGAGTRSSVPALGAFSNGMTFRVKVSVFVLMALPSLSQIAAAIS